MSVNKYLMSRYERRAYHVFMAVGLVLILAFAYSWFTFTNVTGSGHGIVGVILFVLTTYVVWLEIVMNANSAYLLSKMKTWVAKRPQKNLKVAFITTFVPSKEPLSMLERNIISLIQVDYTHDSWVLDEGNDPGAKAICEKYGVKHFSRHGIEKYNTDGGTFALKTKAGNHNAWYAEEGFKYDIVAQVDLDFIVKRNFLTETLGQFNNPKVAFVGTPQYYGNYNDGLVAAGAAEQSFSFYGPLQKGLSGIGMPMLIGANHVVRVKALKSVGWYAGHLTEDLLTGMRLYSAGWLGTYCPKVLAVGEGPNNWDAFFVQQMRWAHGCFDVLFRHSNKLQKTMTIPQRIKFSILLQHYFSGVNLVLGTLLLTFYFLTGIQTIDYSLKSTLFIYVPLLLWAIILNLWQHRFNIKPRSEKGLMLAGRVVNLAAQPIYFLAFIGALTNKKLHFKVTPKGLESSSSISFSLFKIHFAIGAIAVSGLLYGLTSNKHSFVLIFWAVANGLNSLLFLVIVLKSKLSSSLLNRKSSVVTG